MAKAEVETTTVITLSLSESEALFLKAIMQNSLRRNPEEEPMDEGAMRQSIFDALSNTV